jgi:hypothetical protein
MNNSQIFQPKLLAVVAAIAIAIGGVACSDKSETAKPADAAKSDKAGAAPAAVKAALTVTAVQPSNGSMVMSPLGKKRALALKPVVCV